MAASCSASLVRDVNYKSIINPVCVRILNRSAISANTVYVFVYQVNKHTYTVIFVSEQTYKVQFFVLIIVKSDAKSDLYAEYITLFLSSKSSISQISSDVPASLSTLCILASSEECLFNASLVFSYCSAKLILSLKTYPTAPVHATPHMIATIRNKNHNKAYTEKIRAKQTW